MIKLSKWVLVLALCASVGAHWFFLQSVAWVGMAVTYSHDSSSFKEALVKTFDGRHPCKLCKFVAEGKRTEKQPEAQLKLGKINLLLVERAPFVFSRPIPELIPPALFNLSIAAEAPPLPPPRTA